MRLSVAATAICLSILGVALADPAKAVIRKPTNIPAQPLGSALEELAKERDLQVIYRSEVVSDRRTEGAVGEFTPDEALKKLLTGTGLSYRYLTASTVTIVSATPAQHPEPVATTPPSSNKEVGKNSSQNFRLAQTSSGQAQGASSVTQETSASPAEKKSETPPEEANTPSQAIKSLDTVVVTGTLLRRVDKETASPVVTLDRANITNSGKLTLGDELQQLPSVSGTHTNVQNNNTGGGGASPLLEGGDGAARISLRGLGINRTLVLIDGQRMANPDLNMIPQNMVERVDVLAEGASTVYGSDAIGGVVNFILRKDFKGVELSLNDGISSHGDGQRKGFDLTLGAAGDKGNIIAGVNYNAQDPVTNAERPYLAFAHQLVNGVVIPSGSSGVPTGHIQVPASVAAQYGCATTGGTAYVTLRQGTGNALDDYSCYNSKTDSYNFNQFTYIMTQQKRYDGFLLGNYQLTDKVSLFTDIFYNRTKSSGQDAPAGTYSTDDGWYLLASNPLNPFGITFGTDPNNPNDPNGGYLLAERLTGLGTRVHSFATSNAQINAGLKGNVGDSSWAWNASIDYGYSQRVQSDTNEVDIAGLQAALNAGANIFNQANPAVAAQLRNGVTTPVYTMTQIMRQFQLSANGELLQLPAGAIELAVGGLYRKTYMNYEVPADATVNVNTSQCAIAQEACGSPGRGSDDVREAFAETLIPLLAHVPFARSLNLDLGVRTSDYHSTGRTTNGKVAVEWRPVSDMLVRGTATQVFRAPDLDEQYDGYVIGDPSIADPCIGLTAAQLAQHQSACQFVPVNWGGNPNTSVNAFYSGGAVAGVALKPERGQSYDLGLVYSPSGIPGLSGTVDFWRINLNNLLTPLGAQTMLNACFANNASPYCSLIHRNNNTSKLPGSVFILYTPTVNLGTLSTSGVDFTLNYRLPHFNLGSLDPGAFKVGLNTTYTATYNNDATPGQPGATTINYAGTYSAQFGNISRWRGEATFNWAKGNFSAQWQTRWIDRLVALNIDQATGANAIMGGTMYHDVELDYAVPTFHARFSVGADNVFNKRPPLSYVLDTSTYDTLGRYYHARITVDF
ncbi:MAG TPA: TonB-dependent receptor [Steroidobacteraceae bacterium]|nr:TonB-dependent receptor [Steroidobacteraceae bacterium]